MDIKKTHYNIQELSRILTSTNSAEIRIWADKEINRLLDLARSAPKDNVVDLRYCYKRYNY